MTGTPNFMTGTPNLDLLSEVLRRVHLASAFFLRGEFSAPCCVDSPPASTYAELLHPGVVLHADARRHFAFAGAVTFEAVGDALQLDHVRLPRVIGRLVGGRRRLGGAGGVGHNRLLGKGRRNQQENNS